jgi:hypothetical protein
MDIWQASSQTPQRQLRIATLVAFLGEPLAAAGGLFP